MAVSFYSVNFECEAGLNDDQINLIGQSVGGFPGNTGVGDQNIDFGPLSHLHQRVAGKFAAVSQYDLYAGTAYEFLFEFYIFKLRGADAGQIFHTTGSQKDKIGRSPLERSFCAAMFEFVIKS